MIDAQPKDRSLWNVYRVFYQTYYEVLTTGDRQRELVASRLPFDKAKALVDEMGDDYAMWPEKQ